MPTALELSREGWQGYLKRAGRKLEHHVRPTANQQERDRLLALVRQAAQVLKTRFGVKRVILLGSMVRPDRFTPQSDVVVVIEGLRADAYGEAWRVVEEIVQDRPVDLIDLDGASESMRRSVERYGIDL